MMVWPCGYGFTLANVSAMVSPVTVRQSPWSRPASSRVFMSGRMPPMATSALMLNLPLGLRSASTGTRLPMRVKSSMVSFTFAACAMASRCNTAFVEFRGGNGVLRGAVGQTHAKRFNRTGHGVGGIHAAARTRSGDGAGFHGVQFFVADLAGGVLADGFKHGDDVEILALVRRVG